MREGGIQTAVHKYLFTAALGRAPLEAPALGLKTRQTRSAQMQRRQKSRARAGGSPNPGAAGPHVPGPWGGQVAQPLAVTPGGPTSAKTLPPSVAFLQVGISRLHPGV